MVTKNIPDITNFTGSYAFQDFSEFEDAFWQMLYARAARCTPTEDLVESIKIEAAFELWNKRFDCNMKPRWIDSEE